MKTLAFLLLFTQIINTGNRRKVFRVACTPPTMTYRWQVANPSIGCVAGACTSGGSINSLPSSVGSNTATQSAAGTYPIYTTGAINGLPAALFNGSTSNRFLSLTTGLPQTGSVTWYSVIGPIAGAMQGPLIGGTGGTGGSLEWGIGLSGGSVASANSQSRTILISGGTHTISTTAFSTIAITYTYSSGALALYVCSAGTCVSDGTATTTAIFGNPTISLGIAGVAGEFNGYVAEWGYLNSSSIAGIGAYSLCQYGI